MKTNLAEIDRTNFIVAEHTLFNEKVSLVIPQHIGCSWTKETLHFRSSLWNENGELISASFPKFFNFGEKPNVVATPNSLKSSSIVTKEDGSTLIVSKYKGNLICRTRGTVDATSQDNGFEIEELKVRYPNAFNNELLNSEEVSLLFEWVTPNNRIVLNYGEQADIYLIGVIYHNDYALMTQDCLDLLAKSIGVKRPKRFSANTLDELLLAIAKSKDIEGVCLYTNNDQTIHKIKSEFYLAAHKFKSEIGSIEKMLDYYFSIGRPSYGDFKKQVESTFDFEIFSLCQGDVSRICEAAKEVDEIINAMKEKVASVKTLSRKDAAQTIIQAYGNTNRTSMAFTLLDGKELSEEQRKKLFWQKLKLA